MNKIFDDWWLKNAPPCSALTVDVQYKSAEKAWEAAMAISGNYVADHEIYPQTIIFANGRIVKMKGQGHLFVGHDDGGQKNG